MSLNGQNDGEYCLVTEQNNTIRGFVLGKLIEKRKNAWSYTTKRSNTYL